MRKLKRALQLVLVVLLVLLLLLLLLLLCVPARADIAEGRSVYLITYPVWVLEGDGLPRLYGEYLSVERCAAELREASRVMRTSERLRDGGVLIVGCIPEDR